MDSLSVYVPMDRLNALIRGEALAERAEGAALFADLSGFTALTELLIQNLGPKRGAEKLLVFLDRIYEPLIIQVHNYGGSVIGFSGDAITCWFNLDTGIQAIASALAMQEEMKAFASLEILDGIEVSIGLKVAVAAGTARRFLVGEPDIQVIDVLAGSPLEHLAQAEHLAARGEVLVDSATANYLTGEIEIAEWRLDPEAGEYYAVVKFLTVPFQPRPWPDLEANLLDRQFLRQWLLPPIYQRLQSGMGEFLAELRPAVALFLRFGGIDYDEDDSAGVKLDAYIRQVQRIIARFEGSLIQLTVGDKGSYLFAAFGAPIAHEDDANRAVLAAVELSKILPVEGPGKRVQIGISEGRMRTGAYGGSSRRTYGVLGPQTNLAARLMQAAAPGQILVSQLIYKATLAQYNWLELPAIQLKGVREPLPVFALNEYTDRRSIHLQEPQYNLPMVGRKSELAAIEASIQKTLAGQGQIVVITGEAGMGKSRLVAESIRLCLENGLVGFGGECESYGTNTSYHLWYSIWRAFFNVDPGWSVEESSTMLQDTLAQVDPSLVPRLPLLGPVLNLPFPDNDLTRSLDAKRRKTLLEGLLITCLRARAHQQPLLFVLENCHWMDPLSAELAAVVARSIADVPVILLLALRPVEDQENRENPLGPIKTYTAIQLTELPDEEVERLIQLKLEQIYAGQTGLPSRLIQYIGKRAQGNPFYIEELLNYLRDMNINPQNSSALEQIELPESLNSLVLSRIDQCTESQKITLKVASVLGRLFIAAWLWGAFPDLSRPEMVQTDLDELRRLELTSLEKTEPELTYLFKHIITQEVAYESLPYATRSLLHGQIAQFIENTYPDKISQNVDLLAFHYELSFNEPKKREYLLKAGQTAQANYANQAALNYYQHLIPLIQGSERVDVMLKLGQVYELVGQWDAAKNLYQSGLQIGEALEDRNLQALCQTATGELLRKRGAYPDAAEWLKLARQGFEMTGNLAGLGQVLHYAGTLSAQRGEYPTARQFYEESLAIRRQLNDLTNIANLLSNLGILARYQRDDIEARRLYLESLSIRRTINDRWGISVSLNNLGIHAMDQGELGEARTFLEEAVALQREIGDQYYLANYLNNLGNVARAQGDYIAAGPLYKESLERNRDLGDGWQIAYVLEDIGGLAALSGQPQRALTLWGAAAALREQIGAPLAPHELIRLEKFIHTAHAALESQQGDTAWQSGRGMSMDEAIALALEKSRLSPTP